MDGRYESFSFLDVYNVIDHCITFERIRGDGNSKTKSWSSADGYADFSLLNHA